MSDSPAQSVAAVFTQFWDITRLRRGPEDLPVSWRWLLATICLQPLLTVIIDGILPSVPPTPGVDEHLMVVLALNVLVPLLWGAAVLHMVGRSERYLQMMTAVFGSQLVVQPLYELAVWAVSYFGKESIWLAIGQTLYLGLVVWLIVVQARIVRAATDWPMFAAVVAVIMQSLAAYMILFAMFPDMVEALKQGQ